MSLTVVKGMQSEIFVPITPPVPEFHTEPGQQLHCGPGRQGGQESGDPDRHWLGGRPRHDNAGLRPAGTEPPPQLEQERQDWDRKAQCLSQSSFHRMPLLFHWIVREVLLQDLL